VIVVSGPLPQTDPHPRMATRNFDQRDSSVTVEREKGPLQSEIGRVLYILLLSLFRDKWFVMASRPLVRTFF